MLNYTSEDFAEDHPYISLRCAERICVEHGLTLQEYMREPASPRYLAGTDKPVNTEDLLIWLGY